MRPRGRATRWTSEDIAAMLAQAALMGRAPDAAEAWREAVPQRDDLPDAAALLDGRKNGVYRGRYRWDPVTRRYVDVPTGRAVSPRTVRDVLDAAIAATALLMRQEAERLRAGETTLARWQRAHAALVLDAHLWAAAAALGGWRYMAPADYEAVGERLVPEYEYVRRFAEQMEAGAAPMDGRMPRRAAMYAEPARATYEETRREAERAGGMEEERRVTHSMEGCAECAALEAMGWVPIGTLPPLGEQECRGGCKCTFEYRARG